MKYSIYLVLIPFLILVSSCASDEEKSYKEVYEKGVEKIKEQLKVPTSAKFEPYSDLDSTKKLFMAGTIEEKYSTYNHSLNNDPVIDSVMDASVGKVKVDICYLYVNVDAQNSFGTFMRSIWSIKAERYRYVNKNDEPSEWEIKRVEKLQ